MATVAGPAPFQWVMKLINKVSKPAKEVRKDMIGLQSESDRLEQKWNSLKKLALGALGFYTLKEGIKALKSEMQGFDDEWTNLANIFGSDVLGKDMQEWMNQVTTDIPVLRKDLEGMARAARTFNLDIRELDLEAMMSGAIVAGKDMSSIFGEVAGLTQQMFVTYEDAVQASISLTNSTKSANAIMKAMGSTAWNSAERFKALSDVIGVAVPDAIERQKESISGMKTLLSNYWASFKQAMMGDPIQGGMLKEYKKYLGDLVTFFEKHSARIQEIMRGLGEVIGVFIGFFRDLGKIFIEQVGALFTKAENKVRDFHKDIILPFITFLEIIKVHALALIEGFMEGFLQSPVWPVWKKMIGWVVTGLKEMLKFFGLLDPATGSAIDNWKNFGKILGTVFSLWISFGAIGKIVAFGKAFGRTMLKMTIALAKNPLGLILVGITAIVVAMVVFESKADKLHKKQMKRQADMVTAFRQAKKEQQLLTKEMLDANITEARRIELIKEHNKKFGTTIKYTRDLKGLEIQLADATEAVNKNILVRIANRIKEQEVDMLMTLMLKEQVKLKKLEEGGKLDAGLMESTFAAFGVTLGAMKDLATFNMQDAMKKLTYSGLIEEGTKVLRKKHIKEAKGKIAGAKEELSTLDENIKDAVETIASVLPVNDAATVAINAETKSTKNMKTDFKKDQKIVVESTIVMDKKKVGEAVKEFNWSEAIRKGK